MMSNGPSSRRCALVALAAGVCITVGAGTCANVRIAGESLQTATALAGGDLASQPIGSLFLLLPFALAGVVAVQVTRTGTSRTAWFVCGFELLVLAVLYVKGFSDSEHALRQEKWTAAALSIGLLPFIGVGLVLVAEVVAAAMKWLATRAGASALGPG